jgi:hypothetical protein
MAAEAYYTYGSVRLQRAHEAERVFGSLAAYGGDPIVSGIVADNRLLCAASTPPAVPAEITPSPNP